jgi:anti-sigma factor RsiW
MNCQLCQKELDAYREGTLPEGIRIQVENHLGDCKVCAESFRLLSLSDKVMNEEKRLQSNPFLVTRIMAGIEELEQNRASRERIPVYQKVLKPVLISVSVAAAIFIGILAGGSYLPSQSSDRIPVEMSYMNDAALESVELFSQL